MWIERQTFQNKKVLEKLGDMNGVQKYLRKTGVCGWRKIDRDRHAWKPIL
jgi:hypothetical protein